MKKLFAYVVMIVFLLSCSNVDKKYSKDTFEEDLVELRKELSEEDLQILTLTLISYTFQGKDLEGKTYAELIKEGKDLRKKIEAAESEEKALAEKARIEEQAKAAKLKEYVIVSCFEKGFQRFDYEDYITYKFAIQNKSDKNFRAVKGEIIFTDLFDDEINRINFKYDQPIKAGESINWEANTKYNQFDDEDKALKNKKLNDIRVVWIPNKIIFEDGSTIE